MIAGKLVDPKIQLNGIHVSSKRTWVFHVVLLGAKLSGLGNLTIGFTLPAFPVVQEVEKS